MDEIELNGKKYVSKKDYEKLRKSKVPKINKEGNKLKLGEHFANSNNVIATGSVELVYGNFICTRLSLDHLKKAVSILNILDNESVDLVFGRNCPVMLGKMEGKKVNGIIIAPRVVE